MLKLIAAVATNGVIGRDGDLPWQLPDDMGWFKNQTGKNLVLMGSKTFLSLPERFRPLPNRENLVVTRGGFTWDPKDRRVRVFQDLLSILERSRKEDIFVIGGAEVYKAILPHIDELYLTRVHTEVEGDTFFPDWSPDEWRMISSEFHPADEKHEFSFTWEVWRRIQPAQ